MAHKANCRFFPKAVSCLLGEEAAVELFQAEKIATFDDQSDKTCRICAKKLALIKTIVEIDSASVVHLFECECGERVWSD
jgi:hypothetical protein